MPDVMGGLQRTKANTLTDVIGQMVQDEYNKAYAMGQGSQAVAASGIKSSADLSNQSLSAMAHQQSAGASGANNMGQLVDVMLKYMKSGRQNAGG